MHVKFNKIYNKKIITWEEGSFLPVNDAEYHTKQYICVIVQKLNKKLIVDCVIYISDTF